MPGVWLEHQKVNRKPSVERPFWSNPAGSRVKRGTPPIAWFRLNEDDLYGAMDQFNGQWVSLEKQLYQRAFPQAVRLVLYDLTSVYFEG